MSKSILILKATKDICGNEIGLLTHHCQLFGMKVYLQEIRSENSLIYITRRHTKLKHKFDYIYLCTHGDVSGFEVNLGLTPISIKWSRFSQLICETGILKDDTMFLLACCKGGLFQVASDILAVCNSINFVCGVKWNVSPWDLTTGFVVFIHNIENKFAEPSYAAQKASSSTDYTFVCYDRDEVEINPQFQNRRWDLFYEIGWVDKDGKWVEKSRKVKKNAGIT